MIDRYERIRAVITFCDKCGCDLLDNGLHPVSCPYCRIRELLAERDQLAAALEAAQMGLRYAVRVWVLSDEIAWSEEEIDEVVERIIGDAKKEAGND